MKKLQNALDKGSTVVAAVMCAAMMIILFANVVLRLIPGIGGVDLHAGLLQAGHQVVGHLLVQLAVVVGGSLGAPTLRRPGPLWTATSRPKPRPA